MPHRDFNDLDSAGVPLDATETEMREWINGAVAHRRIQGERLTALESSSLDLKDGQQVLFKGHRRLEAGLREVSAQLSVNTDATNATAAAAARTEANTRDIVEAFKAVQILGKAAEIVGKVMRPIARVVSATTWLAVRLSVVGGIGLGGWKLGGDWITSLLKAISTGGKP